ncbi:GATA zinc finger domain-containing protein 10 isoform X2 [Bicyclus anynana]|uniref:GATA zinc finger domain-containing protein 10 isoform X2 n=1 Tax=Bicyclus anynana TaxID=110368 RepID=A0A6J1N1H7_BICAN|nr:GATA zinc finger domain-containing protein 10 isoform X2 [Bicyclus anynana]
MGYYCTVPQCTSLAGKTKNVKFHRFPRDVPMADKWNSILKRGKPYTKYSKVCSLHFTQADYNATTMGQWKTLSKDAIPSQNLPKLNPDGTVMVIRKSRTVKYKESKKDDLSISCKTEKWSNLSQTPLPLPLTPTEVLTSEQQDNHLAYRLHTLSSIANAIAPNTSPHNQIQTIQKASTSPHIHNTPHNTPHTTPHNTPHTTPHSTPHNQVQTIQKPRKQDAIMQTDPVQLDEDDQQNSYSESEKSYNDSYAQQYSDVKKYEMPKDFSKTTEEYIPQTNDEEEYNKGAEKYALERKCTPHNGYDKMDYPKQIIENGYQKPDVYTFNEKDYQNRPEPYSYPSSYQDSVEILRNQQHNLQILQEQHRITENQNFFNENHIKQEIDFGNEEEKFLYERSKEQIDAGSLYESQRRAMEQQRLMEQIQHQVKQEEPESHSSRENVMQPQGSPYYSTNGPSNVAGGYYDQLSRPGPELLIAKQNALAAHTQLWQNMKRPFYYSEGAPYNAPQLLQRYEDLSRILQ